MTQHNRAVFVKECVRDELIYFQQTQYHVSRWNQDWAQERVKYSEMLADNWRRLLDELGDPRDDGLPRRADDPHRQRPARGHGARVDLGTRGLRHRQRLAGDARLVHLRGPVEHDPGGPRGDRGPRRDRGREG